MSPQPSHKQSIEQRFDVPAYRLAEHIGHGGFGQVFKALAVNTAQQVAIKFLSPAVDDDPNQQQRYIERFEREAQLCAHLQHPNIVRLLDKGQCNGLFYAVFEYVEGQTLKQRLSEGPMSAFDAAKVMAQLLDALAHAHQMGVIHRDLKPANIMLSRQGAQLHAKILDFGIGTWSDTANRLHKTLTLTQETLGTPGYSAPEQLRGEPPTNKTDIYVWGLVLLECLTGEPAIKGNSLAAIFHRQLSNDHVPLPNAIAGHPLADFLRRVLRKDPLQRPGDAKALYHQFNGLNFAALVGDLAPVKKSKPKPALDSLETQVTLIDQRRSSQSTNRGMSQGLSLSAERRQLSILCLELSISGFGDNPADEEVADALHRDQLAQCCDIAMGFGGYHSGTLANHALFYFGYPNASDNDARLCARAALEIYSKLRRRNSLLKRSQGITLSLKAAIHSANITIYPDQAPAGIAANVAMNIAKCAMPSQILCTKQSAELLSRYAEFEPAGVSLKPYDGAEQPLYALIAERQFEALSFIRASQSHQRLIGREQPLNQLQQWLRASSKAEPKAPCMHLYGDAGIGKSRLLAELSKLTVSYSQLYLHCLPEYKNSALYPILTVLKTQLTQRYHSKEAMLNGLESRFDLSQAAEKITLSLLYSWLGLPLVTMVDFSDIDHKTQQRLLFNGLYRLLAMISPANQPLLLVIEDIHWADPVTLSFIAYLCAQTEQTLDAIITSARAPLSYFEFAAKACELPLEKLSASASEALIIALFEGKNLSRSLLDFVLNRCDGVALFTEAMVDMLKSRGQVAYVNGCYDFVATKAQQQIPFNLQQLLQYKLDSLTYAKETAQYAAAIGRAFDVELLQAITVQDEQQLQVALNELIDANIIVLQRGAKGDNYLFSHALLRDAALTTLTQTNSQALHLRLAQTLERDFALRAQNVPHLLGQYWAKANAPSQSAHYYYLAGKKAAANYANDETISHYQAALAQFERMNGLNDEQQQRRIEAYETIAQCQFNNGEHQQSRQSLSAALALSEQNPLKCAQLQHQIGYGFEVVHQHQQALEHYAKAQQHLNQVAQSNLAQTQRDIELSLITSHINVYYWLNDQAAMTRYLAEIKRLDMTDATPTQQALYYKAQIHPRFRKLRFNMDDEGVRLAKAAFDAISQTQSLPQMAEYQFSYAVILFSNGRLNEAKAQMADCIAQAESLNNVLLLARCLTYHAVLYRLAGDIDATESAATQALSASDKAQMLDYSAAAKANLAWVAYKRNALSQAQQLCQQAQETWSRLSGLYAYPMQWLGLLLDLAMQLNEPAPQLEQCQSLAVQMLSSNQQKLPGAVELGLEQLLQLPSPQALTAQISQVVADAQAVGYL